VRERLRLEVRGAVQGVGFRPFVYRLARELSLDGWVVNDTRGVVIEVEGEPGDLRRFQRRLSAETPMAAVIQTLEATRLAPRGERDFRIRASSARGDKTVQLLPDIATCPSCKRELFDRRDRRHGYPFTNCTHCGPRFSIIRSLPYDRDGTTMERFSMCEACRTEYREPLDRRFHAQPNACPQCGPTLALWTRDGRTVETGPAALERTVEALRRGQIAAVKGLGGFHLMLDARDGQAIERLRRTKPRREKPLALMVRDLEQAGAVCRLDDRARAVLASPEAPILLLPRRRTPLVHEAVAPENPCLGIMLPSTPLHHLLLDRFGSPLVATSGNLSDEPMCTDEKEAVQRLGTLADLFLVHDRPIARHVDDSVAWIVGDQTRLLRRARGYAPRPLLMDFETPVILAVGAHLKSSVALSLGRQVFLSQHLGDLETPQAFEAFERVIADFLRLYEARPAIVAHDLHPDYLSTRWAREWTGEADTLTDGPEPARAAEPAGAAPRRIAVQHHHAHLAACLAENDFRGPALGVTWDGTGYGSDGHIWGGEFLVGDAAGFRRAAHLRGFRLPGGEAAIREPRRSALGLLFEICGARAFERDDLEPVRSFRAPERALLAAALERDINAPFTTSAGRLFDDRRAGRPLAAGFVRSPGRHGARVLGRPKRARRLSPGPRHDSGPTRAGHAREPGTERRGRGPRSAGGAGSRLAAVGRSRAGRPETRNPRLGHRSALPQRAGRGNRTRGARAGTGGRRPLRRLLPEPPARRARTVPARGGGLARSPAQAGPTGRRRNQPGTGSRGRRALPGGRVVDPARACAGPSGGRRWG